MENNIQLINRIKGQIDTVLTPHLPTGPFALLDFPDHPNVGDSAIWLGNIAWFEKHGLTPSYLNRSPYFSLDKLHKCETIFLHGGGNFGDVWADEWPNLHEHREAILDRFPDKKIVQLPQSIHFREQRHIERTAGIIARHKNFTLLVRDFESLEFARAHFQCQTHLCPDMAFALGPLPGWASNPNGDLFLLRTDVESTRSDQGEAAAIPHGAKIVDWLDEPRTVSKLAAAATLLRHGAGYVSGGTTKQQLLLDFLNRKARMRLNRGVRLLVSHRRVVSDRLHVHILCTLLGIPHVVLDNNYGKISRFSKAFGTDWSEVRMVSDLTSAVAELNTLAQKSA